MNDRDEVLAQALSDQGVADDEIRIWAELAAHIEGADTRVQSDRREELEKAKDKLVELAVAIGRRTQE